MGAVACTQHKRKNSHNHQIDLR